jgi:protein required for attachment to host cells
MAKVTTWIVVADGVHANIYANHGPGKGIEEPAVREFVGDKHPTREINADRPGRTFDSMGGQRHAKEPHTDAHRHAQQVLAHEVAHFLDEAAGRGAYDRLVIAAPPRTLGDLRAGLSAKVQAKLAGDLDKDLMHVPPRDLPARLGDIARL